MFFLFRDGGREKKSGGNSGNRSDTSTLVRGGKETDSVGAWEQRVLQRAFRRAERMPWTRSDNSRRGSKMRLF